MERRAPDSAIADAINRVLAAEHEATDAIASAQREAEALIDAARARRRQILETARRRASLLHSRAQARLQHAIEALESGTVAPGADRDALRGLSREALANLARRLTSVDHEPH